MAKYALIKTAKVKGRPNVKPEDLVWHSSDHLKRPLEIRLGTATEEELKRIFHHSPNMRIYISGEVDPTYQAPGAPSGVVSKPEAGKNK